MPRTIPLAKDIETLVPSDKTHLPVRHERYLHEVSWGERGQVRKNSPDEDKAVIVILGGALSKTGTGRRQLPARAKDEPGISVFALSTNTVSNIRTRYISSRKKKKIYSRRLHLVPRRYRCRRWLVAGVFLSRK